mmetsp:Transcript_1767/g.5472  ORF Transcript_1767/g.5472 Transcript_1767/m.5472 type:complete len:363 (-) Transcript_1767:725-1813(-)
MSAQSSLEGGGEKSSSISPPATRNISLCFVPLYVDTPQSSFAYCRERVQRIARFIFAEEHVAHSLYVQLLLPLEEGSEGSEGSESSSHFSSLTPAELQDILSSVYEALLESQPLDQSTAVEFSVLPPLDEYRAYLVSDSVRTLVVPCKEELAAYPLINWNKIRHSNGLHALTTEVVNPPTSAASRALLGFSIKAAHFPGASFTTTCKWSVCGGTFDHLHAGHKVMLALVAATSCDKATVGITGPSMLTRKTHVAYMQSYEVRESNTQKFLNLINPSLDYRLVQLEEPFGPTISEAAIELMVCSTEPSVQKGVALINEKRIEKGMKPLEVVSIRLLRPASGFGVHDGKLSSTALREVESLKDA